MKRSRNLSTDNVEDPGPESVLAASAKAAFQGVNR